MAQPDPPAPASPVSPLVIAWTGAVALAAAMGLGRFAFTPMLPLMVADGWVDIRQGSWLATLNYIGYLLGALGCLALPWVLGGRTPAQLRALSAPLVLAGLAGTVVCLGAMALPAPWVWPTARLLAGLAWRYPGAKATTLA